MRIQTYPVAAPEKVAFAISGNGGRTPAVGICSRYITQDYTTINIHGSNAGMTEPVLIAQVCQS